MCSFILASISRDFPHGQAACCGERVFDNCYDRLDDPTSSYANGLPFRIAQKWDCNDEIKVYGVDRGTQDKLTGMLADDSTEVRAAALYAVRRARTRRRDRNNVPIRGEGSFPDGGWCYYRYQRRCKPNVPKGAIDGY